MFGNMEGQDKNQGQVIASWKTNLGPYRVLLQVKLTTMTYKQLKEWIARIHYNMEKSNIEEKRNVENSLFNNGYKT